MENIYKTIFAVGGAAASYLFGGWSSLLTILLTFIALDYATGVVTTAKEGKLNSEVGMWQRSAIFVSTSSPI